MELLELYPDRVLPSAPRNFTAESDFVLPKRAKRLSEEVKFEIVRRYLAGESALSLSETFGIHRTTTLNVLKKSGIKTRYRALTEPMIELAIVLYRSGKSLATVGVELKANPETVRRALLKRGVKTRGTHDHHALPHGSH